MYVYELLISLCVACFTGIFVAAVVWQYGSLWDRMSLWQMGALAPRFQQLGLDVDAMKLALRLWGLSLVAIFCLFWFVLGMEPLAIALSMLAYMAPRHVLEWVIRRRMTILRDQLVVASVGVANAVKAGLSLAQALESVCAETPQPLASGLQRIVFEFHRGRPLKEAIEEVRQRMHLEPFTLFAVAIESAIERGGPINQALQRISHSLTEHQRLERKLDADTAAGRQMVLLLSWFPVAFVGMFYFVSPDSTLLLVSTLGGQLVLVVAIFLVYAGSRWAKHIMRIEL